MVKKIYMLLQTDEPEVWVDGISVPKGILDLKFIEEKEVAVMGPTLFDLSEREYRFRELATPETANAFEPIQKEGYSEYSDSFRKGRFDFYESGEELPCFFVMTNYFQINEKAYQDFLNNQSPEVRKLAKITKIMTKGSELEDPENMRFF